MPKSQPKDRNRNRFMGDRLWDGDGVLWTIDDEVDRAEIVELLAADDVRVAVHACNGPLRWIASADKRQVWRDEISPNFHDVPEWRPPRGAPGQLPFHAVLWRNGANRLLIFDDFD